MADRSSIVLSLAYPLRGSAVRSSASFSSCSVSRTRTHCACTAGRRKATRPRRASGPPSLSTTPTPSTLVHTSPALQFAATSSSRSASVSAVPRPNVGVVSDFKSIDLVFGIDCSICALNLKKLWCEFNCSPRQSEFLKPLNLIKMKVGKKILDVLEADLHVSLNTTCNLYKSCSKIPEVTMMSSSAMGFLQFQGNNAVENGQMLINMVFHDEERGGFKPLSYNVHGCGEKVENGTVEGFKNVSTCACNLYINT